MRRRQVQLQDELCQVVRVLRGGVRRPIVARPGIGIVIAPAVGEDVVSFRKRLDLVAPDAQILQAAVYKNDRVSLPRLDIGKMRTVHFKGNHDDVPQLCRE